MTQSPPTLSQLVSSRLLSAVLAAWLLLALLTALGLLAYYRTDRQYSSVLQESVEIQSSARRLSAELVAEMLSTRAYLISGEERSVTTRRLAHEEASRQQALLARQLEAAPWLEARSYDRLVRLHAEYDSVSDRLFALRAGGDSAGALALFDAESDPLVSASQAASRDLQREIQEGVTAASLASSEYTGRIIWAVAGLFLAVTGLAGLVLLRRVAPPLRALDYFESALANAGQTQVYHTIEALPGEPAPALLAGYNGLVERMLAGNAALLRYISRLNHDVNSLLAAILGYAHMIADPDLRPQDASLEEYGQVVVDQARRASGLVEDYVLAARIEAGHYRPARLPVRLRPLLQSLVRELTDESGREVRLIGAGATPALLADSLALEKALRKLLENALHYSPPGTPVLLEVECASPGRRELWLHVRDQGPGIAVEDQSRLFQPFSRLPAAGQNGPGNGLGLFIAQAVARAHGGEVRLQSEPGRGATFTLALPLEE